MRTGRPGARVRDRLSARRARRTERIERLEEEVQRLEEDVREDLGLLRLLTTEVEILEEELAAHVAARSGREG